MTNQKPYGSDVIVTMRHLEKQSPGKQRDLLDKNAYVAVERPESYTHMDGDDVPCDALIPTLAVQNAEEWSFEERTIDLSRLG